MTVIQIHVKPNSKFRVVETLEDDKTAICLKSSPVDGKANAEQIALLANPFAVPKSRVRIKSGHTSRRKQVEINDA